MSLRLRALLRSFCAVLAIVAWLANSNHCALRLWAKTATTAEHHCCHATGGSSPSLPGEKGGLVCCHALQAVLSGSVQVGMVVPALDIPAVTSASTAEFLSVGGDDISLQAPTTGPPRQLSFSETILQRCLLVHAPPVAV